MMIITHDLRKTTGEWLGMSLAAVAVSELPREADILRYVRSHKDSRCPRFSHKSRPM